MLLLERTKQKCIEAGLESSNILVLPMDMCDFASHQKCFLAVLKKFGKLDVLINNAGRSQRGRWEHIDINVDIDLFNLNVFSVINLTRHDKTYKNIKNNRLKLQDSFAPYAFKQIRIYCCDIKYSWEGWCTLLRYLHWI